MRTDNLRDELDSIAGREPDVDDAWQAVKTRVRRRRARTGAGVLAVSVLVIGGAVVAAQRSSNPAHVTVRNPPVEPGGKLADFEWTRAAAAFDVVRVVAADGKTFAVGSANGKPLIAEIEDGRVVTSADPTANYELPVRAGAVNDLVAAPGALVAVGASTSAASGAEIPDAWRSTDGGRSWHSARVEVAGGGAQPVMRRAVVSDAVVYALGLPADASGNLGCPVSVWKSTDGSDFHILPGQFLCAGPADAAAGPAGPLITTMDNATAWHRSGNEWSPRSVSNEQGAPVAIAGSADGYVAVGSTRSGNDITAAIWWSPDGRTWERVATEASPADPGYRQAQFAAVAHSAAGWIAVGVRVRAGHELRATDAIVSTSADGRHWSPVTRDGDVFEQYARADGVGATSDGFAILGRADMTVSNEPATRGTILSDPVMWLGPATTPGPPTGIVEGALLEVGGPPPGLDRAVFGTITVTAPDGRTTAVTTDRRGRYSATLAPGTYEAVGHSPSYGSGANDCEPFASGSGPGGAPIVITPHAVSHVDFICSIR
jgi:hypothetical protein